MFQNSAARLLVPAIRRELQRRCESAVAGPPTQNISKAERAVLGGGMCFSLLVTPAWILYHLRDYKNKN